MEPRRVGHRLRACRDSRRSRRGSDVRRPIEVDAFERPRSSDGRGRRRQSLRSRSAGSFVAARSHLSAREMADASIIEAWLSASDRTRHGKRRAQGGERAQFENIAPREKMEGGFLRMEVGQFGSGAHAVVPVVDRDVWRGARRRPVPQPPAVRPWPRRQSRCWPCRGSRSSTQKR